MKAKLPVIIDQLRETEIDKYEALRPEINPIEVCQRVDAGHQCFVARYKGRLIHACWVTTGRAWIDYLSCDVQLARDEAYVMKPLPSPNSEGRKSMPCA